MRLETPILSEKKLRPACMDAETMYLMMLAHALTTGLDKKDVPVENWRMFDPFSGQEIYGEVLTKSEFFGENTGLILKGPYAGAVAMKTNNSHYQQIWFSKQFPESQNYDGFLLRYLDTLDYTDTLVSLANLYTLAQEYIDMLQQLIAKKETYSAVLIRLLSDLQLDFDEKQLKTNLTAQKPRVHQQMRDRMILQAG